MNLVGNKMPASKQPNLESIKYTIGRSCWMLVLYKLCHHYSIRVSGTMSLANTKRNPSYSLALFSLQRQQLFWHTEKEYFVPWRMENPLVTDVKRYRRPLRTSYQWVLHSSHCCLNKELKYIHESRVYVRLFLIISNPPHNLLGLKLIRCSGFLF